MNITDFIGGGFKEMLGREMSVEQAEELFYKTHDCLSDDVDSEWARIERWANEEGITVL